MDGAASEAVRGLKAEQDTDLALIWEALARRFGFVDEPQRAMRSFYVRKQPEGETSLFSSKACGCSIVKVGRKPTSSRPEADSLLRRKFVDGIMDMELQRHLRVHAAKDDFATTVSKARQFLDASELTRTVKKPAIRAASSNVNYQTLVDSFMEALERRDQGRMIDVSARGGPSPAKQQYPPGQRWGHDSTDQQPPVTANTPSPRRRGCYVCGHPGCHSDFHGPGVVSPGATSHGMLSVRPARMPLVPP